MWSTRVNFNDLLTSYFGDFIIDKNDLIDTFTFEDTREDLFGVSLKQEVIKRVEAYDADWQLHPEFNTNLRDLIGTVADIDYVMRSGEFSIRKILTFDNFIDTSDLSIYPIRIGPTTVPFAVVINTSGGKYKLAFNYDLDQTIFRHIY